MTEPVDEDELRMLLQRVSRSIRRNRADGTMSDSRLGVLFHLKNGSMTPGSLAELERVSPPSMNRTVNSLEQAGLVSRVPDPDDARKVNVGLTAAGTDLIIETRRLRSAWFSQRLAELSQAERHSLEAAVAALRHLAES